MSVRMTSDDGLRSNRPPPRLVAPASARLRQKEKSTRPASTAGPRLEVPAMRRAAFALRVRSRPRRLHLERLEARSLLASAAAWSTPDPAASARIEAMYARLPLSFEANRGQADARVDYLASG